jgi:hypothetical protein
MGFGITESGFTHHCTGFGIDDISDGIAAGYGITEIRFWHH